MPFDRRRLPILVGGILVVTIIVVAVLALTRGRDDEASLVAITTSAPYSPTLSPIPGTSTPTLSPSPTPTLEPYVHTVQQGETGLGILMRYGYNTLDIVPLVLELNNLASLDNLHTDQTLLIPRQTPTPGPTSDVIAAAPPAATEDPGRDYSGCNPANRCSSADGQYWLHEVQSGDTIFGIAYQYDSSATCILQANGLTQDTLLFEGQILRVCILVTLTPTLTPTGGPDSTATPTPTLSPPPLLAPGDGAQIARSEAIVLQWATMRPLRGNQHYLVIVRNASRNEEFRETTQSNILRLPDSLRPGIGQQATFEWQIMIVAGSDDYAPIISGEGISWRFTWG